MPDADAVALKCAVETQHGGKATYTQSVPVSDTFHGQPAWQGAVAVFDLAGHPKAKRAYAWTRELPDGKVRTYAVLHVWPVTSPVAAVRAAIVAEKGTAATVPQTPFEQGWLDGWKSICGPDAFVPPARNMPVPDGFDPYRYGYEQGRAVAGGK
jgi:hypothetical protein